MRMETNTRTVFILILLIAFVGCQYERNSSIKNSKESFRDKPVQFTKHARCMMNCKHISEVEIEKLINSGKLNSKESFRYDKPCPTFAVEGLTADSQNLRVIVGECAGVARVITVINIANEQKCNCN